MIKLEFNQNDILKARYWHLRKAFESLGRCVGNKNPRRGIKPDLLLVLENINTFKSETESCNVLQN